MRHAAIAMIGLVALCAVGTASLVFGHSEFVSSSPADGSTLTSPPSRVDAYFSQDLFRQAGANNMNVTGPNGADVDNNDAVVDPANRKHMSVTLQAGLTSGRYTVTWNNTSDEDGDTDSGSFSFTLELPAATQAPAATTAPGATAVPTQVASIGSAGGGASGTSSTRFEMSTALALACVGLASLALAGVIRSRR
jgi:methionine-rich copper-binding protein CopC